MEKYDRGEQPNHQANLATNPYGKIAIELISRDVRRIRPFKVRVHIDTRSISLPKIRFTYISVSPASDKGEVDHP